VVPGMGRAVGNSTVLYWTVLYCKVMHLLVSRRGSDHPPLIPTHSPTPPTHSFIHPLPPFCSPPPACLGRQAEDGAAEGGAGAGCGKAGKGRGAGGGCGRGQAPGESMHRHKLKHCKYQYSHSTGTVQWYSAVRYRTVLYSVRGASGAGGGCGGRQAPGPEPT